MFQHYRDPQSKRLLRVLGTITSAGLVALALGSGPAVAQQDTGATAAKFGREGECFLERVGTQYVRCDNNTGNGVPAPGWITER